MGSPLELLLPFHRSLALGSTDGRMSKREADKQITQLDPRDEVYEGPPDGGKFAAAPEEVMKKRKIIKPRGSKGGAAGGGGGGIAAGAFGEGIAAGAFGGAAKPMLPTVTSEAAGAAIASVNAELAEAKEGAGAAATTPGAGAAAAVMKSAAFAGGGFGALSGGSAAGLFSGAAAAVPSWGAKKEGGAAAGGAAASGFDVMSLPPIKPAAGGFKFTAASGACSFKAAASGFTFGIAAKPAAAAAGGGEAEGGAAGKKEGAASADGGGEGDPERATSPVFVPAVRVTKVEGHTGEEDEKIVHEQKKVVLYRFESGAEAGREGKWVERGTCTLHLNGADKADKGSRPRIVMRNESMRVVRGAPRSSLLLLLLKQFL